MSAASDFNKQFIMLRFKDLDNPVFMEFVASSAFATYLVMRRHVWRSTREHYMGLHAHYAKGHLACSLKRATIAEMLGGLSERKVSYDIDYLEKRGIIKSIRTGSQSVYMLGEWGEAEGARYEVFYLDAICHANGDDVDTVDKS